MTDLTGLALHPVDLGIIIALFVLTIAIGLLLSRRHDSSEAYFLAGRSMAWPFIGLSMFASNMSSTSLVGLAGDAYATGIAVYNYEWMAAFVLVVFALFFLPSILRSQVYTMPEVLERRFDRRSRRFFSVLTIFLNIVVDTAGSLFAGALILRLVFPEIPLWQTITLLAVVAGIYTIAGGLKAVIYTDAIQAFLLIMSAVLVTIFAFDKAGGWQAVMTQIDPEKLSLIRPADDPYVPWPGVATGVFLLGFYFWCTNQFMMQRVLAAKSLDHGRWGMLFAGFLKLPMLFVMVLPGTAAIILYPQLESADLVYPTLMFDLLPVGLLGLALAGFIAALMSQIDSTLNSASTLTTMDFIRPQFPHLSEHRLMRIGQFVTFLFMLLAVAWAPQIENFASLFRYLQTVLAYAVPPIVALFIVGFFWRGATANAAFGTLLIGAAAGAVLMVCNEVFEIINIHFLYVAPILFVLAVASLVVLSLLERAPPAGETEFAFSARAFRQDTAELRGLPLYRNYRFHSLLIVVAIAVLLAWFW
ncbi:MAG: sodium:solute symporter [Wenzhouxiangellaceae bacterium]|nr:sodium:solute symporter [Wenzhouxiangellaceae bacterium]